MAGIFDLDLGSILAPVAKLITDQFPDPVAKAAALQQLTLAQLTAQTTLAQAQLGVDQAEAANKNTFVAGWRPFIGWTCGAAFGWAYVGQPIAVAAMAAFHNPLILAKPDISGMMPVLLGMLGLGAMRTVEKINGIPAGK